MGCQRCGTACARILAELAVMLTQPVQQVVSVLDRGGNGGALIEH
ncbi:hypothetical protein [Streptomyces sp. NPDC007088]